MSQRTAIDEMAPSRRARRPVSARLSGSKTAGPVSRVFRDLAMPIALRRFANPDAHSWTYRHDIDWARDITSDLAEAR